MPRSPAFAASLSLALVFLLPHARPACAQQGAVPSTGADLSIRITATIPGYLELSAATSCWPGPRDAHSRLLRVRVRANTPWRLSARLLASAPAPGCALRQLDPLGPWTKLFPAAPTAVPCHVPHFAGEHELRFEWTHHGVTPTPPPLELVAEPTTDVDWLLPEDVRRTQVTWPGPSPESGAPLACIPGTVPAIVIVD